MRLIYYIMNNIPFPPLPWHLFAVVLSLIIGIITGRQLGIHAYDIPIGWKWILHPTVLTGITITTTAISIISSLIAERLRLLYAAIILVAVIMLGTTMIRIHDVLSISTQQEQTYASASDDFMAKKRLLLANIYAEQGLKGDEKAVVTAMTLGEKKEISQELKQAYSKSGAAHVFALSGLHIGIIFCILMLVMPRRRHPTLCTIIVCAFLWTYTILVGCRASIIRASIMMTIYMLIPLIGRRTTAEAVVLSTCIMLLTAKPNWLFDIGFQMSFAAVLSIVIFYKHLYLPDSWGLSSKEMSPTTISCCKKERYIAQTKLGLINALKTIIRWIYSITVVSITAQVAVAPLISFYFGVVSPWFLLSNYIVSPCAMVIIPCAIIILILGSLSPYVPLLEFPLGICTHILQWTLHFLNSSIVWIASLPGN